MRVKAFLRYELKYLIDRAQVHALLADLKGFVTPDAHGDHEGAYAITSLYFDTPDYRAYWDKIDGHKVRRKVRVRVYGEQAVTPETPCFVEIKHRMDKRMAKRRAVLPHALATAFDRFDERPPAAEDDDWAVMQEVHYLHRTLHLQPSCIVRYDRLAFNGCDPYPDLRITFDTNLRGRVRDLSLLSTGKSSDQYFLAPEWCILEVKVNHSAPHWLTQILSEHRCTLRRVSKYCLALEHSAVIRSRQRILTGA